MTRRKSVIRLALGLLCFTLLSGCATKMFSPPLRVGTSATMAPLVFVDDDGDITGLEVDFAERLSDKLSRRIEWHTMPFDQLLPALQAGEVDVVMAGLSVTPARQEQVRFTNPYMSGGQMIVFNRKDLGRLNSVGAAMQSGVRFAVEGGSVGEVYVKKTFANGDVLSYTDTAEMVSALEHGSVDYMVQDAAAIWFYTLGATQKHKELLAFYRYLTHEPVAWAVQRNDVTLEQELNAALQQLQADGELMPMINNRIPVRAEL